MAAIDVVVIVATMMKILVLNGPNLGALGMRDPEVYGVQTLDEIIRRLKRRAGELGVELEAFQSDIEGELVARILACRCKTDAIIFNPGAYTHTSIALRDALQAVSVPCVEVHISNTAAREDFRRRSLTAGACLGQIMGFGSFGYELALLGIVERLRCPGPGGKGAGGLKTRGARKNG